MSVSVGESLAQKMVAEQFPAWKDFVVQVVPESGWDNRTFRLGDQMLIRMPSAESYALQVEKEQYWLPKLAPFLPFPIPVPKAVGEPTADYPWRWSIYGWLEGETAANGGIVDEYTFAYDLAKFLNAFESIDATDGPLAGEQSFYRGGSLITYDEEVRRALGAIEDKIDGVALKKVWEMALASTWNKKPVWVHGDISLGNLLVQKGHLSSVIDFGQLAVGDPACDLAIAWTFFRGKSREAFRDALMLDADTWERGKGWALWKSLLYASGLSNAKNYESKRCWDILNEIVEDYTLNN